MRMRCLSCGTEFDAPDRGRARCPNCLRTLGLEPITPDHEESPRASGRGRWAIWAVLGLLAAGGVGVSTYLGLNSSEAGSEATTSPGPAEIARRKGKAARLVAEARALLEQGRLRKANGKADDAFRLDPVSADVRQVRGEIYLASGGIQEAVGEFVAALSLEETPHRHVLAGKALAAMGELERAVRHLTRARELDPESKEATVALALLYASSGQDDALEALKESLRGDGGVPGLVDEVDSAVAALRKQIDERRRAISKKLEEAAGKRAGEGAGGDRGTAGSAGGRVSTGGSREAEESPKGGER